MKRSQRNNFRILIIVHLLVFMYPLVEKFMHTHHDEHVHANRSAQVSFNQYEAPCPVCNFEFYSFISEASSRLDISFAGIPIQNESIPESKYPQQIFYFSLRAPPLA